MERERESHASYADDTLPLYNSPRTARTAAAAAAGVGNKTQLAERDRGRGGDIKTYAPSLPRSRAESAAGAAITLYHALCLAKQILADKTRICFPTPLHPANLFIK